MQVQLIKANGKIRKHLVVARNQNKEIGGTMLSFFWSEEEQRHGHHTRVPQFLLFPGAGKRRVGPLITVQPHPIVTF
jgi:hypothetical protein